MAKKLFDVVATVGEYTNGQGDKKKRYLNVGVVFESEQGNMSMKLDALPTTPEWNGWLSFYEPKPYNGQQAQPQQQPQRQEQQQPAPMPAWEPAKPQPITQEAIDHANAKGDPQLNLCKQVNGSAEPPDGVPF